MMLSQRNYLRAALADLWQGVERRELWLYLGWRDVKRLYNRSVLGPFWLTLSMGIMVMGLGLLYSQIMKVDVAHYLPNLAIGLITWGLISGVIIGACNIFSAAGGSLRQIRMPLSIHIYQFVWSQVLTFAHNFIIYFIIIAVFRINPGWSALLFVPAVLLILLNGVFISLILGPLCARFRDIPMIIASIMQLAFFMTPIIWSAQTLEGRGLVLNANPFYHFIEITRDPLLGGTGTLMNWGACIGITIALGIAGITFFSRYRARVVYWS
ncbi:ABC transporter permease [Rhizobium sp. B230/85]|uniref:ABC transporter permease n=1 Tax=unclassified Rhizobium TaxID=2613769 RepID=UPI001ADAC513|nr:MULTISPECIES: ABC transporter permease [unclassified Rhizobium]MBO9135192.1 ABC transporter permease [Rhizobium sp. B209b/85]QXZ98993.1 ABC transporter permease [Rhizobium sp. B230/85]